MALNKSTGNMYEFITHTWNTIKGECYHDCRYCYMKRWGKLKPVHFDEKELKTELGSGNFIFVGSSCDMFAENIPDEWINKTLDHCSKFDNKYFFQSKNPIRFYGKGLRFPENSRFCTTIESNRIYKEIMGKAPYPENRAFFLPINSYITIEPILDFDLYEFASLIRAAEPIQVNIGADSGNHGLPEPSKEKVMELISEIQKFTTIHNKTNLKRLSCVK